MHLDILHHVLNNSHDIQIYIGLWYNTHSLKHIINVSYIHYVYVRGVSWCVMVFEQPESLDLMDEIIRHPMVMVLPQNV